MAHAPILYQETRLSPTPLQSQILHVATSSEPHSPIFGAGRKRGFDEISGLDEDAYARKYLATEGSVFFRRKSRAPRSFLWRVLDDRKVVEIQSVDLVHERSAASSESYLAFRLCLPTEIVKNGVAFADPDEADALEVFVLTVQNELYTFTLKRDLLMRECVPNEFDARTCFKKYSSNSLSFRHPYRLVAISSLELFIALGDGRMVRLERQPNETGAQWRETHFSEGGWTGTLRGMIPGSRQRVRYGDTELDTSTVAAMAKSPDGKYIWTITLEHELKAWSTETAKPVARRDMLNERQVEDGRKHPKYVMAAEQGTLMQIVTPPRPPKKGRAVAKTGEDESYLLVLHSPKDHQFKIYEITSTFSSMEETSFEISDLQSGGGLIPPIEALMNTNIWHLEDFHVQPGVNWEGTQIWLRVRSGALCRTFNLTLDVMQQEGGAADLEEPWMKEWIGVDPGMQTVEAIRGCVDYPGDLEDFTEGATDLNERWIDFLFVPGRFTTASIESALHIYSQGRKLSSRRAGKGLNTTSSPLEERLVQAVTSKIILNRLAPDQPDYDKYHAQVQEQWKVFFSLLAHLHSRRHDSIGFAYDPVDGLPWSICADFVAPITAASYPDKLALNHRLLDEDVYQSVHEDIYKQVFSGEDDEVQSKLLVLIRDFCKRLSADFRSNFKAYAINEALYYEDGDQDNTARVQTIYDANRINSYVMDDDFAVLEESAEVLGGLGNFTADNILAVLDLLAEDTDGLKKDKKELLRYGTKFTVASAQEILERDQSVLLDLLLFVVFMYGDLDQADLSESFVSKISSIYAAVITHVKHNALLSWLAKFEIPERSEQPLKGEVPTVTLLERTAIGDWDPRSTHKEDLPELLTKWSRQWVYGPYINLNQQWDGFTGHILGFLIKERHYELAMDFQKFLTQAEDSSGWIKYLGGRLLLATGEYALASLKFRAAAEDMAEATNITIADSNNLLSPEERNYFGAGHASFYQHVSGLYEKLNIWSYTADFASSALNHLNDGFGRKSTRNANSTDSPEVRMIDESLDNINHLKTTIPIRDELAGRLFNALLQTGRFAGAFHALNEIDNLNIKKANLRELIEKCVKADAVPDLLALPFEQANLVQETDAILLNSAKKSLASTTSTTPYYQILYSYRVARSDFRGAAEILYERLQHLSHTYYQHGIQDPEDETLIEAYVLLINTLACCGQGEGWLLAEGVEEVDGKPAKRRLVEIEEVRRKYQEELDRRSEVLQGRFPLVVSGDEMDVL